MSPLAADQKRNRRLYTRSGDFPILAQVAKHQFVTVEMVAEDLQRNIISVRRRMLALYQAGIPTPETPVEAPTETPAEPEASESATPSEPEAAPAEEVPAAPEEPASEE